MPNVQVFAWCTLSAVIGFIAGQLSPSAGSSSPSPPRSSPSAPRPASSPRETLPRPAQRSVPRLESSTKRPLDSAPSAEAVAGALARPPVAADPAAPTREPTAPGRSGSLLSSFRFAGFGPHGGVRLGRVARGSLPELLGLESGDEIVTINGYSIADPQQALQAYARLRYVDDWIVTLHRGGARTEVRYALR